MGASVTETDEILAKMGAGDHPEEVFGQSHVFLWHDDAMICTIIKWAVMFDT